MTPWISNIFQQGPTTDLADLPRHGDAPVRVRITHILNPYRGQTDDEQAVQEITFETIRIAARMAAPAVAVRCVCVTFADEVTMVPPDFVTAPVLTRSVLDVARFESPRPLPLVFDILDHGIAVPEDPPAVSGCDDYVIFTNADIHLQPHFYLTVLDLITAGYDVMDIHRQTIPARPPSVHDLDMMFGEAGLAHSGSDCLVFPRAIYKSFVTNRACVGRSFVMRGLVFNLALHARRLLIVDYARLTFHIGNDRVWMDQRFDDYTDFNVAETISVLRALSKDRAVARRLLASLKALGVRPAFLQPVQAACGPGGTRLAPYRLIWHRLRWLAWG